MEQSQQAETMADPQDMDAGKSPPGWRILLTEVLRDKVALFSLLLVVSIMMIVYLVPLFLSQEEIVRVDLFAIHEPPSSEFWLGTDYGGRDVFGQLIIGTRNSLTVGIGVTAVSGMIGIILGVVAGYFGNTVDNIIMRIVDFFFVLPTLLIVIVFIVIVPQYTVWSFIFIMSMFLWMGIARIIRSKALRERELDYIKASRTLGSSHLKIIFTQLMPNLSSIIIVTMTLNLAANIGIESGLSFLGFGFPEETPSLGTLISYATNPTTLEERWWIWVPASILILVLMLSINNVGQALRRAADAKQRRG